MTSLKELHGAGITDQETDNLVYWSLTSFYIDTDNGDVGSCCGGHAKMNIGPIRKGQEIWAKTKGNIVSFTYVPAEEVTWNPDERRDEKRNLIVHPKFGWLADVGEPFHIIGKLVSGKRELLNLSDRTDIIRLGYYAEDDDFEDDIGDFDKAKFEKTYRVAMSLSPPPLLPVT
jgi:hypothetical protein